MEQNTAGNLILEMIPNCGCSLTSGCEKCNPTLYKKHLPSWIGCIDDEEAKKMKEFVADWNKRFNKCFKLRSIKRQYFTK